jgi:hypothetical protein
MYDVKQYDPAEWSTPPLEGRLVDRPGLGKVIVGRGATNTKGPQMAVIAALKAFKATGRKLPVNIALVCEGEEEIGSPNFREIVFKSNVEAALRKCLGIIIPLGSQSPDGSVEVNLGAKGIIEAELVSTGEKWGRGPAKDIHSSLAAMIDSPAWHLGPGPGDAQETRRIQHRRRRMVLTRCCRSRPGRRKSSRKASPRRTRRSSRKPWECSASSRTKASMTRRSGW